MDAGWGRLDDDSSGVSRGSAVDEVPIAKQPIAKGIAREQNVGLLEAPCLK
jgi:hypothetical protein